MFGRVRFRGRVRDKLGLDIGFRFEIRVKNRITVSYLIDVSN